LKSRRRGPQTLRQRRIQVASPSGPGHPTASREHNRTSAPHVHGFSAVRMLSRDRIPERARSDHRLSAIVLKHMAPGQRPLSRKVRIPCCSSSENECCSQAFFSHMPTKLIQSSRYKYHTLRDPQMLVIRAELERGPSYAAVKWREPARSGDQSAASDRCFRT
jgi:hypothetical protein